MVYVKCMTSQEGGFTLKQAKCVKSNKYDVEKRNLIVTKCYISYFTEHWCVLYVISAQFAQ